MNGSSNTLWMGNIENWMSHSYLCDLLKSANIYPKKIIIKNSSNKRGCAFLEFFSPEMAKFVLTIIKLLMECNLNSIGSIHWNKNITA